MRRAIIVLPLPPKLLHPNGRTRRANYKHAMIRKTRNEAMMAALAFLSEKDFGPPMKRARLERRFYFPNGRMAHHDEANLISWCKASEDGCQDAGIILDDRYLISGPVEQHADPVRPRLELWFEELEPLAGGGA